MKKNQIYIFAIIVPWVIIFLIGLYFNTIVWLQAVMLFTTMYMIFLLLTRMILDKNPKLTNTDYRPFISVIVPAHNEETVIADTLISLLALDYKKDDGTPNFEIIAIDDGSTDDTVINIIQVAKRHSNIKLLKREYPNAKIGKPAALNHALTLCTGELVTVFDADSRVRPDFFNKSVPLFMSDDVAGVQGCIKIYNANTNFLTIAQEDEFGTYGTLMMGAKDKLQGFCYLLGNGQIVRKEVLTKVGGWNVSSLTEDFDMTLRISLSGSRIRYAPEAIVWQEAVETLEALIKQRKRWVIGFMHASYSYIGQIFNAPTNLIKKLDMYMYLFVVVFPVFMLLMYSYYILSFSFDIFCTTMLPATYMAASSFIFYIVFFLAFLKIHKEHNPLNILYRMLAYGILNICWILVFPVALIEVYKGQRNGHPVWEKTQHNNHQRTISENKKAIKQKL